MSGLFTRVLQDLLLYIGPNGTINVVEFNYAWNEIFAHNAPRSLQPIRAREASRPCQTFDSKSYGTCFMVFQHL